MVVETKFSTSSVGGGSVVGIIKISLKSFGIMNLLFFVAEIVDKVRDSSDFTLILI